MATTLNVGETGPEEPVRSGPDEYYRQAAADYGAAVAAGIHLELVVLLVLAIVAVPLNLRLARKYQPRIDALDRSQRGS